MKSWPRNSQSITVPRISVPGLSASRFAPKSRSTPLHQKVLGGVSQGEVSRNKEVEKDGVSLKQLDVNTGREKVPKESGRSAISSQDKSQGDKVKLVSEVFQKLENVKPSNGSGIIQGAKAPNVRQAAPRRSAEDVGEVAKASRPSVRLQSDPMAETPVPQAGNMDHSAQTSISSDAKIGKQNDAMTRLKDSMAALPSKYTGRGAFAAFKYSAKQDTIPKAPTSSPTKTTPSKDTKPSKAGRSSVQVPPTTTVGTNPTNLWSAKEGFKIKGRGTPQFQETPRFQENQEPKSITRSGPDNRKNDFPLPARAASKEQPEQVTNANRQRSIPQPIPTDVSQSGVYFKSWPTTEGLARPREWESPTF